MMRPHNRAGAVSRLIWLLMLCAAMQLAALPTAQARPRIAVVLGGGAARGYSHIGLLAALEEEGVPVDIVVGTSMGSMVAGLYAVGLSTENLTHLLEEVDLPELIALSLPPRGGVLNPAPLEAFLSELTGGAGFNELSRPFYSVVTELTTGEEVALQTGSLARAIIASISIPGMFPPVEIDGRVYVDGGLKNAVPANVARAAGADVVIAVDVKKELEEIDHNSLLTNLQLTLWFMIEGYVDQHIGQADVVVVPPVQYDSYMEYARTRYFIESGYAAAKEAMPQIRQAILSVDPSFSFDAEPMPGLDPQELSARLERALSAARAQGSRWRFVHRPVIGSEGWRWQAALTNSLPWGLLGVEGLAGPAAPSAYFGLTGEAGDCLHGFCAAVRLRKYEAEKRLRPGFGAQAPIGRWLRTEADWEPGRPDGAYRFAVTGPRSPHPDEISLEWRMEAGRDPRGLSGRPHPAAYRRIDGEVRLPLSARGVNVSEVAVVFPLWFAGADARSYGSGPWEAELRTGLETESRLFGLYAARSRFELAYRFEDETWRWAFHLRL